MKPEQARSTCRGERVTVDGSGKPDQFITAGNEDVLQAPILKFGQDGQPKLGRLAFPSLSLTKLRERRIERTLSLVSLLP